MHSCRLWVIFGSARDLKKVKINSDYWQSSILGFIIISIYPVLMSVQFLIGTIKFSDINLVTLLLYVISMFVLIFNIWGMITERRFKRFHNQFTKIENDKIITIAFKNLDWEYLGPFQGVYRKYRNFKRPRLFNNFEITIITNHNAIDYNILFYSNSHLPRWPYFLGLHWFIERKLMKEFKKHK